MGANALDVGPVYAGDYCKRWYKSDRYLRYEPVDIWDKDIKDIRDLGVGFAHGRDFIQETLASIDICQVP